MNVIFTQICFGLLLRFYKEQKKKKSSLTLEFFALNGFLIQQVKVHLFKLNVLQANRKVSVSGEVCQSECRREQ